MKLAFAQLGSASSAFVFGILVALGAANSRQLSSVWTHTCVNGTLCRRDVLADGAKAVPLAVCKLNCHPTEGSLWPLPSKRSELGPDLMGFHSSNIVISGTYPGAVSMLFASAASIFKENVEKTRPANMNGTNEEYANNTLNVQVTITEAVTMLSLGTAENYTMRLEHDQDLTSTNVTITAPTFFGARHALETLSQLIAFDEVDNAFKVVGEANIEDSPAYTYRGLLLDTSRNYIPVADIKKTLDAMSYSKLNMFHWHLTDTHSFPMEVANHSEFLTYGAYSMEKVYTLRDMEDLVAYAKVRGVKIVPELDQPAHMGFGWQFGPEKGLGNLVVCLNDDPWYAFCVEPPCGQINIANQEIYPLLGDIYRSMLDIFDNDLFHMGGDEVHLACYNESREITDYMATKNYTRDKDGFMALWGEFQNNSHTKLVETSSDANIKSIMWTSELTDMAYVEEYLDKEKYFIQLWSGTLDPIVTELINTGYKVIFSNYDALYLDCGFQAWLGAGHNWCSPYKGWQQIYDHSPYFIYANATSETIADDAMERGLLLGGETPLWSEQADSSSFHTRLWPRAAALAERLWTNPNAASPQGSFQAAENRMVTHRERIVVRGVPADRLQPEFCSMYQGSCYDLPPAPPGEDDKGNSTGGIHGIHSFIAVLPALLLLRY